MKKMKISKILVPIDFSNNSMNALQTAAAIAKRHKAKIHLLYVNDSDFDLYKDDNNLNPPEFPEFIRTLERHAKSVINSDKLLCTYSTESGSITHCILKTSIDIDADLIVMGKNGSNGYSPDYAGTHTCQVAEKSRTPVLIVPEGITKYTFEKILFPARPLLSVLDKYDAIHSLILKNKPSITILNLRNPDYINELHIIDRLSKLMKAKLEEDDVPYTMEYYFKDNKFAEHVLNVIEESAYTYDLAVITAELNKANKDFHIGKYAQKIIHSSKISLLVIHPENVKLNKDELLEKLEEKMSLN